MEASGCPCSDTASEEVCVFGPDGAAEGDRARENWPVVRIAQGEPFPGGEFELAVDFTAEEFRRGNDQFQVGQRNLRISTAFRIRAARCS